MGTSLTTIGLIVTGIILLTIIGAFIFSEKFRKDVIASQGEASVLGMFNVKGVLIILLTVVFCGAFIFIIQLDTGGATVMNSQTTIESCPDEGESVKLVMQDGQKQYELRSQVLIEHYTNNTGANSNKSVKLKEWNDIISYSAQNKANAFCFRIDSIIRLTNTELKAATETYERSNRQTTTQAGKREGGETTITTGPVSNNKSRTQTRPQEDSKYLYLISFGERAGEKNKPVIEAEKQLEIYGSANHSIGDEFEEFTHPEWSKSYYVLLKIGNVTKADNPQALTGTNALINAAVISNKISVAKQ